MASPIRDSCGFAGFAVQPACDEGWELSRPLNKATHFEEWVATSHRFDEERFFWGTYDMLTTVEMCAALQSGDSSHSQNCECDTQPIYDTIDDMVKFSIKYEQEWTQDAAWVDWADLRPPDSDGSDHSDYSETDDCGAPESSSATVFCNCVRQHEPGAAFCAGCGARI